jgi:outer membrane protein OmpA-like peptidoglycan-associated protein
VQHAYYYGQTDPSVYNSPWPPVQHDGHSNVHAPSVPATSQAQPMTYMQPAHQSPVDSQQGYDTASAPSYATTLQNFDVGSFGMGHDVHSQQQQHQVRKSPSNMYFEDASMHLKMQSLPILNSLVSLPV